MIPERLWVPANNSINLLCKYPDSKWVEISDTKKLAEYRVSWKINVIAFVDPSALREKARFFRITTSGKSNNPAQ